MVVRLRQVGGHPLPKLLIAWKHSPTFIQGSASLPPITSAPGRSWGSSTPMRFNVVVFNLTSAMTIEGIFSSAISLALFHQPINRALHNAGIGVLCRCYLAKVVDVWAL